MFKSSNVELFMMQEIPGYDKFLVNKFGAFHSFCTSVTAV